jgi:murein L,D-transpeptidase YafK
MKRIALAASLVLALAACQGENRLTRHLVPIPTATMALMESKGLSKSDPILIRAFKKESEMEVWKRGSNGKYALLKTYPICRWSGQLGPKVQTGDRQTPEGFYTITPAQMNPNSSYYLSFDTGYPNAYDQQLGRTGSLLMVHGSCSSAGCFAMTDESIAEIYALAREAFAGGQRSFQFQSYPFRMTAENLAKHRLDQNIAFWKNLKEGSDAFEVTHEEPQVGVGNGRYVFDAVDPSMAAAVANKSQRDDQQVAALVARGVQPVRVVYADGGRIGPSARPWRSGRQVTRVRLPLAPMPATAWAMSADRKPWRPDRRNSSSTRTGTRGGGRRPTCPMHPRTL